MLFGRKTWNPCALSNECLFCCGWIQFGGTQKITEFHPSSSRRRRKNLGVKCHRGQIFDRTNKTIFAAALGQYYLVVQNHCAVFHGRPRWSGNYSAIPRCRIRRRVYENRVRMRLQGPPDAYELAKWRKKRHSERTQFPLRRYIYKNNNNRPTRARARATFDFSLAPISTPKTHKQTATRIHKRRRDLNLSWNELVAFEFYTQLGL